MINNEIIPEAKRLEERIKLEYPKFVGKTASNSDLAKLERGLKIIVPKW